MTFRNIALFLCLSLVLFGCSSGGGDSPPAYEAPVVLDGVFIDSPVQGLEYGTGTQAGETDALGAFHYIQGETITFSIGGIVIGQGLAKALMTPIDLVSGAIDENDSTVINICRFLQTLDDDGNPANGIVIPAAVITAAQGQTLDFTVPTAEFCLEQPGSQLIATLTALTSVGQRQLVSAEEALRYFREAIGSSPSCTDADGDGYSVEGGDCGEVDCDDADLSINPGAAEVCGDDIDQDCSGADLGCEVVCTDVDGDGYSLEGGECGPLDCDDAVLAINPGAAEICGDGVDQDCAGGDPACPFSASSLVDTGQTTSYTAIFGEDSDYTINPPSYTDNSDGTVTDNVTGLMWQQDDNTTYNWYEATGTADATSNPGGAVNVCGDLALAGYGDWRLPTKKELLRIVHRDTFGPAIDTVAFPNTNSSYYWSSTTNATNTGTAWSVNFYNGYVDSDYKTSNGYVRCVRGGQ